MDMSRTVANCCYFCMEGQGVLRAVLVAEALIAHVLAENAAIGDQATVCNSHVVVYLEDLLVGTQELVLCSVQGDQHSMGIALQ